MGPRVQFGSPAWADDTYYMNFVDENHE